MDHFEIAFSLTLPVSSPSFPFSFLQFPLYLPIKLNDILSFNIFVTTCSQMCNIEGPGSIDQQQQKKSQIVRSSATPIFNKIWVKLHVFKFHMIVKDLFVPLNLFHLPPFFLVWSLLSSSSCFHLSLLLSFLTSFFYVTSFFPYFFLSLLTSYFPYIPYFFLSFFTSLIYLPTYSLFDLLIHLRPPIHLLFLRCRTSRYLLLLITVAQFEYR